jgi:hypothetical protein
MVIEFGVCREHTFILGIVCELVVWDDNPSHLVLYIFTEDNHEHSETSCLPNLKRHKVQRLTWETARL